MKKRHKREEPRERVRPGPTRSEYTTTELLAGADALIAAMEALKAGAQASAADNKALEDHAAREDGAALAALRLYLNGGFAERHALARLLCAHAAAIVAGADLEEHVLQVEDLRAGAGQPGRLKRRPIKDASTGRATTRVLRAYAVFRLLAVGVPCEPRVGANRALRNDLLCRMLGEELALADRLSDLLRQT